MTSNHRKKRSAARLFALVAITLLATGFIFGWTRSAYAEEPINITEVALTDANAPKVGETPSKSGTFTLSFSNDKIYFNPYSDGVSSPFSFDDNGIDWYEDGVKLQGGTFTPDHQYKANVFQMIEINTAHHNGVNINEAKATFNGEKQGIVTANAPGGYWHIYADYTWTLHEVRYHANAEDATGTMANQSFYEEDESVTLDKNAFTRTGYVFAGWSTTEDGEVEYSDEATIKPTSSLDLYAQWKPATYTIKFVNDDGTELQTSTVTHGETPAYTGEAPTKAATDKATYTFKGWTPDIVAATANATYTATYTETPITYIITFNANGGKGDMDPITAEVGTKVTLTENKFTRTGYTFNGWNTQKDGKGTSYKDKDTVELTRNMTLYAQWTKNATSSSSTKSGGTSSSRSSNGLANTSDASSFSAALALALSGAGALVAGRRGRR